MGKIGGESLEEGRGFGLCAAGQSRRSRGAGTQKPSRPAGAAPHKSALHACKSPHRCYCIYRGLRGNCFLFAKFFSFMGFSPPLQPRSLVPGGHIEKSAAPPPPPPHLPQGRGKILPGQEATGGCGSIDECPSFAFSSRETRLESCVFEIITSISHVRVVGVYVFLALFDYCC